MTIKEIIRSKISSAIESAIKDVDFEEMIREAIDNVDFNYIVTCKIESKVEDIDAKFVQLLAKAKIDIKIELYKGE